MALGAPCAVAYGYRLNAIPFNERGIGFQPVNKRG